MSKTEKLVMGSSTYDFGFDVLLEDPTGKDDKIFQETIATIEQKILRLKSRIENSK